MSKLRLSNQEKELCGFTPVAVETLTDDELGAKSALPRDGFIPSEEIGSERENSFVPSQLRECMDPLELVELRINPKHYGQQPLARNMRLV